MKEYQTTRTTSARQAHTALRDHGSQFCAHKEVSDLFQEHMIRVLLTTLKLPRTQLALVVCQASIVQSVEQRFPRYVPPGITALLAQPLSSRALQATTVLPAQAVL